MSRLAASLGRLAPRRFRTQIVLVTVGLALVNFLLIGWYVGHDFVQLENGNTQRRFDAIAGNLSLGATPLVIVKDYGSLENLLVAASRLPGLRSLAVTDARGRVLSRVDRDASAKPRVSYSYATLRPPARAATRIRWIHHSQVGPIRLLLSGNDTIEIWRPIGQQGLGWLYLRASAGAIHAEFAQLSRKAFGFLLLLFLSSAALLVIFLRPSLEALARATRFAHRLGSEGQGELALYRGNRELRELGETLNDTARKLRTQDAALRANQARLSAILENLSDGVVVLAADGSISLVNPAFCGLFGVDPARAAIGGIRRYLPELSPAEDGIETALARCCARPGGRMETVGVAADGERIALAFAVNLFEMDGRHYYVGSCHDLREREGLIGEIERARDAAVAANRAKSDFLASMSHEIRTPMNGIIGMLELLQQSSLSARQARMAELSKASALSLLEIINDILDHAKIEAGKLELVDGVVHPERCLMEVGSFFDLLAQKKDVAFSLFVDPALPVRLRGDELRLRQIMTNLIGNAIKFSAGRERPGQVSVRAELASSADGDWCRLSVLDNGIGMEDAAIARMFLPFEQADRFTTKRYGGTGLGLAISRHLVDMMHGRIEVASKLGEGSVFTVYLPLRADQGARANHGSELAGLHCTVHAAPNPASRTQARDLVACLLASGARVDEPGEGASGPPQAGPAAARAAAAVEIWLADETAARQRAAACPHAVVLLLDHGRRRVARRLERNLAQVDGNLLTRTALVDAVRIAARMEPAAQPPGPAREQGAAASPEPARSEGRPVLVAEDNETNQQVIRLQLERLGWTAHVVADGEQALRRWEDGEYGLLLSDLHMPRMDGFELARAIREREALLGRPRTAIVALTAAAMPSELARALHAGMDDYVTKPVSLGELQEALGRWSAAPAGAAHLDPAVLPRLVGGDGAVVRALRQQYLSDLTGGLEELERAGEDRAAVAMVAHRLKSASRTVGAAELGMLLEQLEHAAGAAGGDGVRALVERVRAEALIVQRQHSVLLGADAS